MINFGKYLLNYLYEERYRYHPNVLESSILEPETSLILYFENANKLTNRVNLFFNPNITIDFLKKYITNEYLFLDFEKISYSSLLNENDILKNPDLEWNYNNLIQNKNINPIMIINFIMTKYVKNKFQIIENIYFNKSTTLFHLRKLEEKIKYKNLAPTKYLWLLKNGQTNLNDFEYIQNLFQDKDIFAHLSGNKNLNLEFVIRYRFKNWDWKLLSSNPSFSILQIVYSLNLPWNFNLVSIHPKLTIEDILKYKNLPWNYENICVNKNITIFDLEKLPNEIFKTLFDKKYIFYNEHWDSFYFEKYHKIYNFSQQNINLIFLTKKPWIKKIMFKKRQLDIYYDELMKITWHPSRLINWIWDIQQINEWNEIYKE